MITYYRYVHDWQPISTCRVIRNITVTLISFKHRPLSINNKRKWSNIFYPSSYTCLLKAYYCHTLTAITLPATSAICVIKEIRHHQTLFSSLVRTTSPHIYGHDVNENFLIVSDANHPRAFRVRRVGCWESRGGQLTADPCHDCWPTKGTRWRKRLPRWKKEDILPGNPRILI